jgi:hypothetical protein
MTTQELWHRIAGAVRAVSSGRPRFKPFELVLVRLPVDCRIHGGRAKFELELEAKGTECTWTLWDRSCALAQATELLTEQLVASIVRTVLHWSQPPLCPHCHGETTGAGAACSLECAVELSRAAN